jgi:hypothetical protein
MAKEMKKIHVDGSGFFYIVHEKRENVLIRTYPASNKTTCYELAFSYKHSWAINFFKPSVAVCLIRYVIERGWKYQESNQIVRQIPTHLLIEQLELASNERKLC